MNGGTSTLLRVESGQEEGGQSNGPRAGLGQLSAVSQLSGTTRWIVELHLNKSEADNIQYNCRVNCVAIESMAWVDAQL